MAYSSIYGQLRSLSMVPLPRRNEILQVYAAALDTFIKRYELETDNQVEGDIAGMTYEAILQRCEALCQENQVCILFLQHSKTDRSQFFRKRKLNLSKSASF